MPDRNNARASGKLAGSGVSQEVQRGAGRRGVGHHDGGVEDSHWVLRQPILPPPTPSVDLCRRVAHRP